MMDCMKIFLKYLICLFLFYIYIYIILMLKSILNPFNPPSINAHHAPYPVDTIAADKRDMKNSTDEQDKAGNKRLVSGGTLKYHIHKLSNIKLGKYG